MITRERKAREALEKQLAAERAKTAEEQARAAEERREFSPLSDGSPSG